MNKRVIKKPHICANSTRDREYKYKNRIIRGIIIIQYSANA